MSEAERLVREYSDLVLRLSYTYLGSTQDAEDVCQTVFLKLITASPSFSSREHEKAWVIRVAANVCKDLLKSAHRQRTSSLEAFEERGGFCSEKWEEPFSDDSPVAQAVQQLPVEQREAVYQYYYEGYPINDIARITGSSPAAVAKRLSRARETLRKTLGRRNHG